MDARPKAGMTGAMPAPDPMNRHPVPTWHGTRYLKAIVKNPQIIVGDYSYYDDSRGPEHFEARCVRYLFDFVGDRLVIGKFVAIAQGRAVHHERRNHPLSGFSTFPFSSFEGCKENAPCGVAQQGRHDHRQRRLDRPRGRDHARRADRPWSDRRDARRRGEGRPALRRVVGNPAGIAKLRFDEATIAALLDIAWWDWDPQTIARHVPAIAGRTSTRCGALRMKRGKAGLDRLPPPHLIAALMGATGVALWAASSHGGAPNLQIAAQMLLIHAAAIPGVTACRKQGLIHDGLASLAVSALILGVILFAADLWTRARLGERLFPMAAPLGGVLTIAGWTGVARGSPFRAAGRLIPSLLIGSRRTSHLPCPRQASKQRV